MFISPPQGGYDYIITLFFIDTSLDVISTLHKIYTLLRPEGMWINLGPLLWTGGFQAKVELCLEELELAAEGLGFRRVDKEEGIESEHLRKRRVECEYTADTEAMMKWIYQAEFCVFRKL
jgi:carnosine N-methyltransferase